MQRLLDLS